MFGVPRRKRRADIPEPKPRGQDGGFFFSIRRRHTRCSRDWSSDVCSSDLTHSLNAEVLLKQFLLLLRKIIGVNRSVVFMRQPAPSFGESAPGQEDERRLRSVCAMGLSRSEERRVGRDGCTQLRQLLDWY